VTPPDANHTFTLGDAFSRQVRIRDPAQVQRVSLVWWRTGPDDASPLFAGERESPSTLVAEWPCTTDGLLLPDLTGVTVRWWKLSEQAFADVQSIHLDFHVGRHDLLVRGDDSAVSPTPESLYRLALQRRSHPSRRIERMTELLLSSEEDR
jgi:hypothetical protein